MVYKWAYDNRYSISADVVGKHFEKLEKEYGSLDRNNVLDSARAEDSPIHELFEWDDTVAAEQYRLHQASALICSLTVEINTENKPIKCRAYLNVSTKKEGRFVNIDTAFQTEDTREIVFQRALNELKAFQQKYRNLSEFSNIFAELDKLAE